MSGSKRVGMAVQERDRHLLRELDTMRLIDREQAELVGGFHSIRRANARLLSLTRAGYLRRIFIATSGCGQKGVYTLSPKGAAVVGAQLPGLPLRQSQFGASPFLLHRLAINEIYLTVKYRSLPRPDMRLARWLTFRQPLMEAIPLIPDAYFEIVNGGAEYPIFLEADLGTESLPVWQRKTQLYLQLALSGQFSDLFRQSRFRVVIVATTERRLRHIKATIAKATEKIFWLTTFEQINQRGFWSPIWLRPSGDQPLPLL